MSKEVAKHIKLNNLENKIPDVTTLINIENKISDVSSLVKKRDYNAKISNIVKNFWLWWIH